MTKKMVKKLMLVLTMVVLCFAVAMTANAQDRTIVDSGECGAQGDNVVWTLYDDGELVISGEGEMTKYSCGPSPFYYSSIKSVVIEDGVTTIGDYAFYNCDSLTSVTIPDSVTAIGEWAFQDCDSLTSVTIPDSVTTIGDYAFDGCDSLASITIGDSVTTIGDKVLYFCLNLEKITVDENNPAYSSDEHGVLFNKDKTELICYPSGNEAAEYVVPDTVQTIKEFAFFVAFALEKIELPDSLKKLEIASFYGLFRLEELNIPAGVEIIEPCAIVNVNFADIRIESMNAKIDEYSIGGSEFIIEGISQDDFADLFEQAYRYNNDEAVAELEKYLIFMDEDIIHMSTIYCHAGSTAETYAIESGADYVLTHFYEGEWIYDYDNMIRYRKCIHCDELETEQLETTTDSDVEIIEPVDPDTDFTVDVVTDYVIIEETIANNVSGDFEVVKAFDITLKNKDGVHVQPDGTVKVKLPLHSEKDGVYKVYRVNDDGTLTDMNAYRQGSHMVFETDHFSIYVIVDESEKTDAPVTPDEPQAEPKDDFFSRIIDWFKTLFDLIFSIFK